MITAHIPAPTVEPDGDDTVMFTCGTCADTVDDGNIWMSFYEYDPDNETMAEFAVSVYLMGDLDYENHFTDAHMS